ncbi:asparagine synthase-related protein [Nocardioides plantarum]|uniref:Asparagine synthase-related protein n=1 Tax=Nocardioides plantarum TaxID=29299 RepID=A0ABV5K9X0_9ACTN|nr:asparagine synthase-related protein [Nocardioides plantarum]
MRVYLAVLSKDGTPLPDADTLARLARVALPFATPGPPDLSWSDRLTDRPTTALHAWHNEPDQPGRPLLTTTDAGAAGFSGYAATRLADGRVADDSPGVWSSYSAAPGRVRAATCASGTELVFHAETPHLVVLGNRASLVHLVARASEGPGHDAVALDPVGLAAVVNAGFHTTARTVFRGLSSLDPATTALGTPTGLSLATTPTAHHGPASVQDVADALVRSVADLPTETPVRLGLTGGRDSRLLAALLARAGSPVLTRTAGLPDDPDVVVARDVAAALGLPHVVQRPAGTKRDQDRDRLVVDPRERLREAVGLGEGMISAYDRVGRLDQTYDVDLVPFSGSGGEILRGYYASTLDGMEIAEVGRRVLKRRAHPSEKLLHPSVRAAYLADLAEWRRWVATDPATALEAFYVRQRTGRWSGVARGSSSAGSLAWRPFFDHGVVEAVRRTPLAERTSERLFAALLDTLAPELADVRFAGKRWKFDAKPPTEPAARAAWDARSPLTGTRGGQASYDWRTDAPEVRDELRRVVEEAPPALWEVLDETAVTRLLAQESASRSEVVTTWHLATVAETVTTLAGTTGRLAPREGTSITVSARPTAQQPPPAATPGRAHRLARTVLRRAARHRRPRS